MKKIIFILLLIGFSFDLSAQTDSNISPNGIQNLWQNTSVNGYGNAFYQRDMNEEFSTVNLERFAIFLRSKVSNKISLFSEIRMGDANIQGGLRGVSFSIEQAYLKFNLNPKNYLVAGLYLPRIGILNENHIPTTFLGNERNQVEKLILPVTWRQLGIGFYGELTNFPLTYSAGLVNGLNSEGFEHGTGIGDGRFDGLGTSANNLAVTASLGVKKTSWNVQVNGYYGGSVGLSPRQADSLRLNSGMFGAPVMVGEAHVQYHAKGFSATVLGTLVSIPEAADINRAYANNTPEQEYGAYAEVGYNVLESIQKMKSRSLKLFARYEILDVNAKIPSNGIDDGTLNQQHMVIGLNYAPSPNVAVKADVRIMNTGDENPQLVINPSPVAPPYQTQNTFFNLGIAFSF